MQRNSPQKHSSSVARSRSPYALLSYTTFRDEDLHTTMRTPMQHAIEGHAPGISTAKPSSGVNQYGGIRRRGRGHIRGWVCLCCSLHHNCEVKIEVMENPRFMSEARRKELERGKEKRLREESTSMPVVKEEKRKLSFSPHPHHRAKGGELEAHAASAIQQPAWIEQERKPEVMGASSVLPLPSSFQSYQSSCETKRFFFQRLVPR